MDVNDRLFYVEQRLADVEKRLSRYEEKEYYKYLTAGQTKQVLEAIEKYKDEPILKKEPVIKRNMWSLHYRK